MGALEVLECTNSREIRTVDVATTLSAIVGTKR